MFDPACQSKWVCMFKQPVHFEQPWNIYERTMRRRKICRRGRVQHFETLLDSHIELPYVLKKIAVPVGESIVLFRNLAIKIPETRVPRLRS